MTQWYILIILVSAVFRTLNSPISTSKLTLPSINGWTGTKATVTLISHMIIILIKLRWDSRNCLWRMSFLKRAMLMTAMEDLQTGSASHIRTKNLLAFHTYLASRRPALSRRMWALFMEHKEAWIWLRFSSALHGLITREPAGINFPPIRFVVALTDRPPHLWELSALQSREECQSFGFVPSMGLKALLGILSKCLNLFSWEKRVGIEMSLISTLTQYLSQYLRMADVDELCPWHVSSLSSLSNVFWKRQL